MKLYEEPQTPGDGRIVVGEWGGYYVDILPVAYNHRVVLTPMDSVAQGYSWGWCYHSFVEAYAAVMVWDPDVDAEPIAYIKHATEARGTREPGQTAKGWVPPQGQVSPAMASTGVGKDQQ